MLSPGPCTPNEAGICLALIARRAGRPADPRRLPRPPVDRPGARRRGDPRPDPDARQDQPDPSRRPGRSSPACPTPSPRRATTASRCAAKPCRPHSRSPPGPTTARSWASRIATRPVHGVQFHPESIATEGGHQLLANFLELAGVKRLPRGLRPPANRHVRRLQAAARASSPTARPSPRRTPRASSPPRCGASRPRPRSPPPSPPCGCAARRWARSPPAPGRCAAPP